MRQITHGSTNISVDIYIVDDTDGTPELGVLFNTSGIDLEYRREGAVAVNVTEVTLAALTTAHADGGFLEIGHGYYRFDVPDAAFASGAKSVSVQGTVTGMVVLPMTYQLIAVDLDDTVRAGLTALPNAAADAAGGLVISDAGGLDMDGVSQAAADLILPPTNTAFSDIEFLFVATSDHVTPVTGATGTAVTRSIDGGAFGSGTGTLAEVANGIYQYDASQADMNGKIITFRFTGSGGTPGAPDDAFVTLVTSA